MESMEPQVRLCKNRPDLRLDGDLRPCGEVRSRTGAHATPSFPHPQLRLSTLITDLGAALLHFLEGVRFGFSGGNVQMARSNGLETT
jgi:hypothetical protein